MRIMRKVLESGLTGFTEDCVEAMQQAVEDHLKGILANHVHKVKRYRVAEGVRYSGYVAEESPADGSAQRPPPAPAATTAADTHSPQYRHVIRLRDLLGTLEMAPHLLGENRGQLDKLMAIL